MSYLPDSSVMFLCNHYSATDIEEDVSVEQIDAMHRRRNFRKVGYHLYIRKNGLLEYGRDLSEPGRFEVGAHSEGENNQSIGICYEGGVTSARPNVGFDSRTKPQIETQIRVLNELLQRYPKALVTGHRNMPGANTQCPGFEVKPWWDKILKEQMKPLGWWRRTFSKKSKRAWEGK